MTKKSDEIRDVSRRFKYRFVRICSFLILLLAAGAWSWDEAAGQGVLLGGGAGLIGFWLMARAVEQIAINKPEKLRIAVMRWTVFRMGLYGAAFVTAFGLDREQTHGLLGAVVGFLAIRAVLTYLGLTSHGIVSVGTPSPKP